MIVRTSFLDVGATGFRDGIAFDEVFTVELFTLEVRGPREDVVGSLRIPGDEGGGAGFVLDEKEGIGGLIVGKGLVSGVL